MNRQTLVIGALTIAMTVAWNGWILLDESTPGSPGSQAWQVWSQGAGGPASRPEPRLWRDIKKTSVEGTPPHGDYEVEFAKSVLAIDGQRVELPGVGFLLASGVQENEEGDKEVTEFLLLPGDGGAAWCCGLAPIPNFEFSVLVECPESKFLVSQADPKSRSVFVNVEGTFRLRKENSIGSLYTIDDATVEFIDVKEVMPPGAVNLCLQRPMARNQEPKPESHD